MAGLRTSSEGLHKCLQICFTSVIGGVRIFLCQAQMAKKAMKPGRTAKLRKDKSAELAAPKKPVSPVAADDRAFRNRCVGWRAGGA